MNKVIFLFLIAICFASCKTAQINKIEKGVFIKPYMGSKFDIEDELILNQDGTFSLEFRSYFGIKKCQGQWYYLDDKTIHLKCDEPKDRLEPILKNEYMLIRERNIKIINENKIKLEIPESITKKYIVMKRKIEQ